MKFKYISLFVIFIMVPIILSGNTLSVSVTDMESGLADENEIPLEYSEIFETEELSLVTDSSGDFKGTFAVKNKKDGSIWYSNPVNAADDSISLQITEMKSMILVTYLDPATNTLQKANSYLDSVLEDGMELFALRRGFRFDYNFPALDIKIPVTILVNDDNSITARVVTENIVENGKSKIFGITLLPYFCAASKTSSGFIFIPDGSGAVMELNNNKTRYASYNQPVYGGDYGEIPDVKSVNTARIAMPVFGLVRDGTGMFTVIEKGATQSNIHAFVSGIESDWNVVYNDFELRKVTRYSFDEGWQGKKTFQVFQETGILIPKIENKYYFLSDESAGFSGMADLYRKHLGLPSLEEVSKYPLESPEVTIALIGGVRKKVSVFGVMGMKSLAVTGYEETLKLMMDLQNRGAKNINVRYVNWNKANIDAKIPDSAKPHRVLGGKSAYEKMSESLQREGIEVYPDIEPMHFTRTAYPFQQFFNATRNLNGQLNRYYPYTVNLFNKDFEKSFRYVLNNRTISETWGKLLKSVNKLPSDNLSFSSLGQILSSDYYRKTEPHETWQIFERDLMMIREAAENSGSLMLSFPNLPASILADKIIEIPANSNFDITDYQIPFYQMVIAGRIRYTGEAVNLAPGGSRHGFLSAAATGGDLYYAITPDDSGDILNDTEYADWISTSYSHVSLQILQQQEELQNIYMELGTRIPTGREVIEPQVWKCIFINKNELLINFNSYDVLAEGRLIPANGYIIVKGE